MSRCYLMESPRLGLGFSREGRPDLRWPPPGKGVYEDAEHVPLTDKDISELNPNGPHLLFSTVSLSTEGGKHRL